jgi:ATP-dependent exoDNAse (exonuclease V) alpha subunit
MLTKDQQTIKEELIKFINDPTQNMFLIGGYAGSGKTFLIVDFVKYLLSVTRNKMIGITGPTHKSTQVLFREACKITHPNLIFSTIHSALGLKEHIDGFGKQHFKRDKHLPCKVDKYQYLVLDEISMLHDEIFDYLLKYPTLKIIFVGDPAQIPPINKLDSIPLLPDKQKKYNIQVEKLTKIVRQCSDNPIIKLTFDIRSNLNNKNLINELTIPDVDKNNNITFFNKTKDEDKIIETIYNYFTSNEYKQDSDYIKIIAWRNETVNIYNELVRYMLYGDKASNKIMRGERLIMDSNVMEGDHIILHTNEEVEVEDFEIDEECINFGKDRVKYYDTVVKSYDIQGNIKINHIHILHEDSEVVYNSYLNGLKNKALKEKQGTERARTEWIKYYAYMNHFASTKYNYSISAHKSQGSTYNNTIVMGWDIMYNSKIEERNRILYTACSRPKNNLILIK